MPLVTPVTFDKAAKAVPDLVSPWVPMTRPIDLKHLGKLNEELSECGAAVSRCVIQGINEMEPVTDKVNRRWLEEEIADVLANVEMVMEHFGLDRDFIAMRRIRKKNNLRRWHMMLGD